ncbi:MAG: hypothetical protein ACI37S_02160 [Candidatus Gastranaerophilaceae bacterium]
MVGNQKKLSIAFYWHMHQPVYKLNSDSDFLMPWVRMHAVKDYLDMVLVMNEFPNLKLNFNLVPILLESLQDYAQNGAQDFHSRLSTCDVSTLSDDDKRFILNNFFDANFQSMISHHESYKKLYEKRVVNGISDINEYSNQEYSDIMAWFNMAWFDPVFGEIYPELLELSNKGNNYTQDDRIKIIAYQREIIRQIIPTYRNFMEAGKIELTTSPYYHPILPILLDIKCAQRNIPNPEELPQNLKMSKDAIEQTKLALDKMENLFGKRPKGIWPPEHCVSAKTMDMLSDLGIEWTITDEGILANSINFDFVRNFKGYLNDPYHLLKTYEYKTTNSKINVIFRDSLIPNLISFEYPNTDPQSAANDLYDRIKVIQNKIFASPDESHLLTIALDGENSWENYSDDGSNFLRNIYQLIEDDETLETVLISDYIENDKNIKNLPKVYSGSWINRNFQLWIGEPTKNKAWNILKSVRDDFIEFVEENPNHPNIEKAQKEIYIAEGSDWFWWYGEPNHSGQDHVFDYLFREHLKNVYRFFGMPVPSSLETPLIPSTISSTQSVQTETITPIMDSQNQIDDEWLNSGTIEIYEDDDSNDFGIFEKLKFGFDNEYLYIRLFINKEARENNTAGIHQMYMYFRNKDKKHNLSPIRLTNPSMNISHLMQEKFSTELQLSFVNGLLKPIQYSKAAHDGLWYLKNSEAIKVAFDNTIDISIPFNLMNVDEGEIIEFLFATANFGTMVNTIPQEVLFIMQRPINK